MNAERASLRGEVRLRGAAQFTGAFQRRYRSQNFLLLVRSGGSKQGSARLGIVIGRRQLARAVDRARLRRNIREIFRGQRNDLGQIDVIVRYRGQSSTRVDPTIQKELMDLLGACRT